MLHKKRRLRRDLITINSYLKGGCREDEARIFPVVRAEDEHQWAMVGTWEVPTRYKENNHHEAGQTWA